jgi:hypothetical protein
MALRVRPGYPPSVLLHLGGYDAEVVGRGLGLSDLDRVPVVPAPGWMERAWRGPVAGMALPWAIYLRPDVVVGDPRRRAALIAHELVHVRQWRELGPIRFLAGYVGDYLRGRLGGLGHDAAYRRIALEAEAEAVARAALGRGHRES